MVIINHALSTDVYIINSPEYDMPALYLTPSLRSLVRFRAEHSTIKFIVHKRACNILYMSLLPALHLTAPKFEISQILLVFSVTPFKMDQIKIVQFIKSRIWGKQGGKCAKIFAKIQTTAIFLMQDMQTNLKKINRYCF